MLTPSYERALLARCESTPRERAELHGLTTRDYVETVYDLPPASEARADAPRPTPSARPHVTRSDLEARARAIIADLAAGLAHRRIAARHGVGRQTIRDIRDGRTWPELPRPWEEDVHA